MFKRIIYSAFCCLLFQFTHTVNAQNCDAFFNKWIDFAKNGRSIGFTIVALGVNGAGSTWGQYAEGTLKYNPSSQTGTVLRSANFSGEGLQYFSDRMDACPATPPNPGGFNFPVTYWFGKNQADKMKIDIPLSPLVGRSGCRYPITLTLVTWGNSKATFCPSCYGQNVYLLDNGMIITFRELPRGPN